MACWAGALVLIVTLAGCGSQDDPGGGDVTSDAESSTSPEQADQQMAQYREPVCSDTKEVDDVTGRVDPSTDARRPLYQTASSTLKGLGYAVEELVDPNGDARVIADRGLVTVTVQENVDAPMLLFRVSGPCLIIPEEQCDSYFREEPSPDVVPRPES